MLRRLYLLGAIVGFLLPYVYLVLFILENGFDVGLFISGLFANRPAAVFSTDVLVSSFVLWLFVFSEGRKLKMNYLGLYVVCNLLVGVSFALPLFLYVREGKLVAQTR